MHCLDAAGLASATYCGQPSDAVPRDCLDRHVRFLALRSLWLPRRAWAPALLFVLIARLFLRLSKVGSTTWGPWPVPEQRAYIGILIAVYVPERRPAGFPSWVFQLGSFTPMFFVLADWVAAPVGSWCCEGRGAQSHGHCSGVRASCSPPRVADAVTDVDLNAGSAAPLMILLILGRPRGSSFGAPVPVRLPRYRLQLALQPTIACGAGVLPGPTGPALMRR